MVPSPRSRSFLRRHWRALLMALAGLFFLSSGAVLLWAASLKIPDLSSIESRRVEQSLKIYDRTGTVLLYDMNKNIDRTIIPLSGISPNIQHATIAMEDPTFYQNTGIEPTAILRAILIDIATLKKSQGGSTLTQQVVRQTILSTDKTFTRKLKELVLSLKLTRVLPKDQILEIYLNQAPYGGAIYGVQEASEQFFGVPASDVTLPQAAYLAAVLSAPTYYSPYGNHKDTLDALKNVVLDKMYEQGYISAAERDSAKNA
ncbi:MAG TPA: transglycosylase domain-containing protein, partial [Candidatus Paceibacterota bacterium]